MQKDITLQRGSLLGQGRTAEVFAWGNDKVLKLFYSWFPQWPIEYEADVGRAVYETGVPAPKVYGVIDCDGRKGIIYQRIFGRSLIRHMEESMKIEFGMRLYILDPLKAPKGRELN